MTRTALTAILILAILAIGSDRDAGSRVTVPSHTITNRAD